MPVRDPRDLDLLPPTREWLKAWLAADPLRLSHLIGFEYRHQLDLEARLFGLIHSGTLQSWDSKWLMPGMYYTNALSAGWETPRPAKVNTLVEIDCQAGYSFPAVLTGSWYEGEDRVGPRSAFMALPLFDSYSIDLFLGAANTRLVHTLPTVTMLRICVLSHGLTDQQVGAMADMVQAPKLKNAFRLMTGRIVSPLPEVSATDRLGVYGWAMESPHASAGVRELLTHKAPHRTGLFVSILSSAALIKKARNVGKGVMNVDWVYRVLKHPAIVDDPDELVSYLPMVTHPSWARLLKSLVVKTDLARALLTRKARSVLELPRFHVRSEYTRFYGS